MVILVTLFFVSTKGIRFTSTNVITTHGVSRKCLEDSSQTDLNAMYLLPTANEVWGKVIFSEACVKNSVHREGYLDRYTPWQVHPPGQVHPSSLAGTHPPAQVHIPLGRYTPFSLAGTPPWQVHTPLGRYTRPRRYTPLMRGRYASC